MRGAFVLAGMFCCSVAFAYDPAPVRSFAKPTSGGKHVLVMLHPFETEKAKVLKEKYGHSGLYPVNDATRPVWLCDWTVDREENVFVSADGVYAGRVPDGDPGLRHWLLTTRKGVSPKAVGWDKAPALLLYKNGKLFRTLTLREVFDCSQFTDRDCFMGPVVKIDAFEDITGQVVISSEADGQKQTATIAFRAGEVVPRGAPGASSASGESRSATSGATEERSWGRIVLIGMAVVGVCTAAFAVAAVLLIRHGDRAKI